MSSHVRSFCRRQAGLRLILILNLVSVQLYRAMISIARRAGARVAQAPSNIMHGPCMLVSLRSSLFTLSVHTENVADKSANVGHLSLEKGAQVIVNFRHPRDPWLVVRCGEAVGGKPSMSTSSQAQVYS
jgi:hypothetical protein